ncbi:MAG: YbhB/YbcL family Raf kinase inhibitor-like protein [Candidatus Pacebacteria bacterium]|nr:YbhB/YbcL family Raf kinase inhibitor-like protein [Candidatus Paceibacterota bacterium]
MGELKVFLKFLVLVLPLYAGGFFILTKVENPSEKINKEEFITMEITSSAFKNDEMIPEKYTCDGENVNPSLKISNVPQEAKSLALIIEDPDAGGGIWAHWLVWNIDPKAFLIEEGSVPKGSIEGTNDYESQSYEGPCPPSDIHHYYFKLYALDDTLDLDPSSRREDLIRAMETHIIDQADLVGLYKRK